PRLVVQSDLQRSKRARNALRIIAVGKTESIADRGLYAHLAGLGTADALDESLIDDAKDLGGEFSIDFGCHWFPQSRLILSPVLPDYPSRINYPSRIYLTARRFPPERQSPSRQTSRDHQSASRRAEKRSSHSASHAPCPAGRRLQA